ncbi:MAG: ribulose-phosphate 3-epimerase [Microbacteriaceae bacterium]
MSNHPPLISASLLAADPLRLAEEVASVNEAADLFHVDVMDFHFAENSFGTLPMVQQLKRITNTPLECHLMVQDVMLWAPRFAQAGCSRIVLHAEMSSKLVLADAAKKIRENGAEPILAMLYYTDIEPYLDEIAEYSTVMLITVPETGFGAQSTEFGSFNKISRLQSIIEERQLPIRIAVDGGIGEHNIQLASAAGASQFVVGSDIFNAENREERVHFLRSFSQHAVA